MRMSPALWVFAILGAVLLASCGSGGAALTQALTSDGRDSTRSRLLEESDLRYIGAFRLDEDWKPDNVTLEYSNGALAYYPLGNSGRGSLFVAGHVYRSMVAEYEIPTPVASKELAKLPVARVLQPLSDVLRSVPNRAGNAFIMGMVYVPTLRRIVFTHGGDYTAADCSVTASTSGVVGTFAPTLAAPGAAMTWTALLPL